MTAQAQPTEISSLNVELTQMLDASIYDEARVRQIEVRASYLLSKGLADSGSCYMAQFLAAHITHNEAAAVQAISRAVANPVCSATIIQNAVVVLSCIGRYDDAVPLIERMVAEHPDSKRILFSAIIHLQLGGLIARAAELIEPYERLRINDPPGRWPALKDAILSSNKLLSESGFSDAMVGERLASAVDFLRTHGTPVLRMSRFTLDSGEFISQLYIKADPEQCAHLNFDIADMLVDKFEDPGSAVFSIVCRPHADIYYTKSLAEGQ